jgi:hypothetical protein
MGKYSTMKITDEKKIIDIQSDFNSLFPYLKVEFYKSSHEEGEGTEQSSILDPYTKIRAASQKDSSGELKINEEMKVAELEKVLADQFGLNAQVFRKSQGIWLQTTATDHWTLKQQNESGQRG